MSAQRIVVSHDGWRAVWEGGRLADIFYGFSDDAVECIQAGEYDWQTSTPTVTRSGLRARLREWARDHGAEYMENVIAYR